MKKLAVIVVAMLGVALLGGLAYVAIFDIPAPSRPVEKVIPNERFAR